MAVTVTTPNTVLGALLPKEGSARTLANIAMVVLGTALLTLSAKINVPVWPVPVTLQTFAVAALAGAFGWRIGVATVALYIVEGLIGLPVFARGGGFAYVFQPSFGFIVGYLPMAYFIGRAADAGASSRVFMLSLVMLVADAMVFLFGFLWLVAVAGMILSAGGTLPSWLDANNLLGTGWNGAVGPFLLWDALKMIFAAVTVAGAWTLLKRRA